MNIKWVIIILLVLAVLGGFIFWKFGPDISFFGQKQAGSETVELTYWGLWEDASLVSPVIDLYQSKNPGVKINYQKQSSINYRTRLQAQIDEGLGPDVLRIHNSWLPMMQRFLAPAPENILAVPEFKNMFYPVAVDSFVKDGRIYAAPMEIDGLVLFYNEELLTNIGGKAPRTWEEFVDVSKKMTVADSSGIKTAGAGIGSTGNVDHWSDILGLMLMQQGVDMENPATEKTAEVARFYTGFITDPGKKVWDVTLPKTTQMFVEGRLGFYFAPSWRAHEIRQANPDLKFKIVPVPQLPGKSVAWASFWGEAVSNRSKSTDEAWKFVKFLVSPEAQKLMYQEASKIRLFGEPYSLTSLQSELLADPLVGAVVLQGPIYKGWYLSSNTFDNGINDQIIKYWEDAINSILQGKDIMSSLKIVESGVKQVLDNLNKPESSTTP